MGHPFTADFAIAGSRRWARPAGSPLLQSGNGRRILGVAHRRLMGRSFRPIPVAIDLLQAIRPLGESRGSQENTRSTCARPEGMRWYRSHGMLLRRPFHSGDKRGIEVGKTKQVKGTKPMVVVDASGLPLAVYTASVLPHDAFHVEAAFAETITDGRFQRIVKGRAYDSDSLDQQLAAQGIELIAPHRRNRVRSAAQDGRALRRWCRRWKAERLTAFVYLAFSMILMRRRLRFMK